MCICSSQEIGNSGGTYVLNLSTQCLSVKTCGILAKLLFSSNLYVDIKFNDCSLPDEGMLNWLCRMVYKSALSLLSWFIDRYSYGWCFDTILWKDIHELSWFVLQHFLLSVELMLQVKLLPGGISSLLRSVNLILFTLLLAHLILCISPCHSHHLCSHHLSLPRSFTPDLHLICSQILSSIFFLVPSRILDLLSTGVEMSFARSLMVLFSSVQSL